MRFCSLLVLTLAVVGCDSTPAVDPPTATLAPVLPLAVGAEWTLTQTTTVRYGTDGSVDTTQALQERTHTLTVSRDTVVAGETWFWIDNTPPFSHCVFDGRSWFANREDGLYRWRTTPEDAERVYAIGVPEGEPFLVTPIVTAVLADDDAMVDLGAETVAVRQYDRTWKRLEFNATLQGPIDPQPMTRDQLSSTLGPVSLELSYVRTSTSLEQFEPAQHVRFELAPAAAGASARTVPEAAGAYVVR